MPVGYLVAILAIHVVVAVCLAWTWRATGLWVLSLIVCTLAAVLLPWPLSLLYLVVSIAWLWAIVLGDRSPLAELVGEEREWQHVIHGVSSRGRELAQAGRLDAPALASLVWELERIEPPAGPWRHARDALLLDLRAHPPQTDAPGAMDRLVAWPWRVALDHRLTPLRLALADAMRRRDMRHLERIQIDKVTREVRYDVYFLRILSRRFDALRRSPGGLGASEGEARAMLDLLVDVPAPDRRWAGLAEQLGRLLEQELEGALGVADDAMERAELSGALRERWADLERAALAAMPFER